MPHILAQACFIVYVCAKCVLKYCICHRAAAIVLSHAAAVAMCHSGRSLNSLFVKYLQKQKDLMIVVTCNLVIVCEMKDV